MEICRFTDATYFSGWDYYTADGGLISNVYDMNIFMQRLFGGNIINTVSMNEMLTSIAPKNSDTDFFPIQHGLGIFKIATPFGEAFITAVMPLAIMQLLHIFQLPELPLCGPLMEIMGRSTSLCLLKKQ